MATNTNFAKTRLNGREKYLDLKIDTLGALIAKDNYSNVKDLPTYATRLAKYFPKAVDYAGAFVGSVFTPTIAPTWLVDELKDQYAVFYKLSDVSTLLASGENFKNLSLLTPVVIKILSNTATAFTTVSAIPTGMTNAIIMSKAWYQIAQIANYDFSDAIAQIDANDADSGGFETFIDGLKSAGLTGLTGHFYPKFHTLAQLENAKLSNGIQEVRHGATDLKYATVFNQVVSVSEFTKGGAIDGTAKLEYTIAFTNKDDVKTQTILVDGTIPDFM